MSGQDEAVSSPGRRVAVLADDLMWAMRLASVVERAGLQPVRCGSVAALEEVLAAVGAGEAEERVAGVVVDLNGRRYDGVEAVRSAHDAGTPVIAVGQHEDLPLRRAALDAGAHRVYSYNKLFSDGPAVVEAWLATATPVAGA